MEIYTFRLYINMENLNLRKNVNLRLDSIRLFQPADQVEIHDLILEGLKEHWGKLDPNLNPDLKDIYSTYKDAYFLVARKDEKIVGCGALCLVSDGRAEIKRMSVSTNSRRQGIGYCILDALIHQARQNGVKTIILETTSTWTGVVDFYLNYGFQITHHENDDTYFRFDLKK
jgi:N-acetylglutamate synthase-like GNAT family acetyltransferase